MEKKRPEFMIVYNYGLGFVILINQFPCLDEEVLSLLKTLAYIP